MMSCAALGKSMNRPLPIGLTCRASARCGGQAGVDRLVGVALGDVVGDRRPPASHSTSCGSSSQTSRWRCSERVPGETPGTRRHTCLIGDSIVAPAGSRLTPAFGLEQVAQAAHGADVDAGALELAPQPVDVHLDRVAGRRTRCRSPSRSRRSGPWSRPCRASPAAGRTASTRAATGPAARRRLEARRRRRGRSVSRPSCGAGAGAGAARRSSARTRASSSGKSKGLVR